MIQTRYKHGLSKTRLHMICAHMKDRCFNPASSDFNEWGGRGITICKEWLGEDGFINFYHWAMANGYSDGLTIERINNDGDYEAANCRWATKAEQTRNRRNVVKLTYNGRTMSCAEWANMLGLSSGTVNNRLHKGWNVEECLFGREETYHKISNMAVRNKIQELNLRKGE